MRGLAEALNMELIGTNVRVMLSYPPDTDTPGLQQENTTKPVETKIISGTGGLHTPEYVGTKMIQDALVRFLAIIFMCIPRFVKKKLYIPIEFYCIRVSTYVNCIFRVQELTQHTA